MFKPDLPDPPSYTASDFAPSVNWGGVKYVLVYKEADGDVRVISCKTKEEFEAENLATIFSDKHELIESWSFDGQ